MSDRRRGKAGAGTTAVGVRWRAVGGERENPSNLVRRGEPSYGALLSQKLAHVLLSGLIGTLGSLKVLGSLTPSMYTWTWTCHGGL
jgi:hypothetical protein